MPPPPSRARTGSGARWAAVLAGTAALLAAVLVGPPAGGAARGTTPQGLLERAAASAPTPYTGLATSTGALGLPDLPRLGEVAALFGQSTRTRTWWAGPGTWRVDVLTATGEQGSYAADGVLTTWDYEDDEIASGAVVDGAHLPRAVDLLPPALARSLVAGPGGAEAAARGAQLLGARRVAGRSADGVRVVPADRSATTLDHADVWVDRASGLPLQVDLVDAAGTEALTARFDSVDLARPDPAALAPPPAPGADREEAGTDLAALADEGSPWRLPERLAGLAAASDTSTDGVVAYGGGLARLVVLPLPPRLGGQAVDAARAAGGLDLGTQQAPVPAPLPEGASAVLLRSGALGAVLVDGGDRRHAYLVGGTVPQGVLAAATAQLLADPPPWDPR